MKFVGSIDAQEYDAFVAAAVNGSVLQSAAWAKVKSGWEHSLTGLRDGAGNLVAAGLVLRRPLPLGLSFWYVPHGPVLDYGQPQILEAYLTGLTNFAKKFRAVAVRIDPPVAVKAGMLGELPDDYDPEALDVMRRIEGVGFAHRGFVSGMTDTLQPRVIPVTLAPEGEFFAALPKKSRTMANNARNRYVDVTYGGAEVLDQFLDVITETEKEKDIRLRSRAYYEQILDAFGSDARIYIASLDIADALTKYRNAQAEARAELEGTPDNAKKKINRLTQEEQAAAKHIADLEERQKVDGNQVTLAGVLMVRFGPSAEMLYAGTNRNYGNIPAQHLMWVRALEDGFADGLANVSLGGVDGSLDDSLMRFKSRFIPTIMEKLGEFQKNLIPPVAWAIDRYLGRR